MTIFLLILKIIGIILLCIVLLILTLILLLLFYPFTYRIIGSYHEKPDVHIHVHWLIHIVSFHLDYVDSNIDKRLCIFGIKLPLFQDTSLKSAKKTDKPPKKESKSAKSEKKTSKTNDKKIKDIQNIEPQNIEPKNVGPENTESKNTNTIIKEENTQKVKQKKPKKEKKKKSKKSKPSKISKIKKTIEKLNREIHNTRNQMAVKHLKEEVFRLLKMIMPSRLKLQGTFSTGAPDTTGIVLGILAMFPIGYINRFKITPDFEADKAYVDGDMDVKGKLFLFQLVGIVLRVLFDKNCRYLFRKIKS